MADKKISELTALTTVTGQEMLPLSVNGSNKRATLQTLKPYFRDSTMMMFADVVDGALENVSTGTPAEEEGAVLDVIYAKRRKIFFLRKTLNGTFSYFTEWATKAEYMDGNNRVRTDRVFFCTDDKHIYIYNGASLVDLFDSVRIHVLTEEELENLQNPIEGAIYATLE